MTSSAATKTVLSIKYATEFLLTIIFLILITITNCDIINNNNDNDNFKNNNNIQLNTKKPPPIHECGSIDIRNGCSSFKQLENCTVINGFLLIVLVPTVKETTANLCNFQNLTFPLLREITDFLIFYEVRGIKTLRNLLPNLTVIRGRRLFLNYALGITKMPQLEFLEFRSLIAIQRGHVFVGSNPKLCSLEKIFWDRLTLTNGVNHINLVPNDDCPEPPTCIGCESEYCWSNFVCQKFENTNLINLNQGIQHCHEECLGGCYNTTDTGCAVCKGLTDHGACVATCPPDKYLVEHYQRCYTSEECIQMGRFLYQSECVSNCSYIGQKVEESTMSCIPCSKNETCNRICNPKMDNDEITIYNLEDVDFLSGCEIINGSLIIMIRNQVNEQDLLNRLGSIREIIGYLKIIRSLHLTSLQFLQNLTKIHGQPLESDTYSLIIYDNPSLKDLWQPKHFELSRGSMFVHLNNKLCNSKLKEFARKSKHYMLLDSIQISDKEVLCMPLILQLQVEALSHRQLKFNWLKEQTSDEVELLIHKMPTDMEKFDEESEFDSHVCKRIEWQRELLPRAVLHDNGTHYSYVVDQLAAATKYACFLKTFGNDESRDARSKMMYAMTKADIPLPPELKVTAKTDTSLTIILQPNNVGNQLVNYYKIFLYEFPEDLKLVDERNYCAEPAYMPSKIPLEPYSKSNKNEDYDDCCARQAEEADDRLFIEQIRNEFSCSLDRQEYCLPNEVVHYKAPISTKRLTPNESVTFQQLVHFRLYGIDAQACNDAGCSSYTMHHERTNFSTYADRLDDLRACRVEDTTEYHINFSEPKQPNGAIVSYVLHYRILLPNTDAYQSHINCITRLQHAQANYFYIAQLNYSYNEVAVRVHSLAGDLLTNWVNVSICHDGIKPRKRIAGFKSAYSLNTFLIFFLIGAGSTLLWICYKRRLWRKLLEWRRFLPEQCRWLSLLKRQDGANDDRQILVDDFEVVRFQNNSEDL